MNKKTKVQKKPLIQEATPEIPSGRFWMTRIEPGVPTVLGKDIWPGSMIVKNHGPGTIVVESGYDFGERHIELLPGALRVIATYKKVDVATIDENSALLEFEYMADIRLK
jgi:hypothetical protein